ncbi:MAG: hypothetical protein ACI4WX_12280 [Aristaeellaceae bacterium]
MADVFKLQGKVSLDTSEFNDQVDDAKKQGESLADSIEKSSGNVHDALEDALSIDANGFTEQVKKVKQQGESLDDAVRQISENIRGALSIRSALENALSFSAGQLITDGLRESWSFIKETASESMELASSLREVQNVVDVTFGAGASEVDRWAQAAKNAFGMSELKAKQFTGTMGAMLKSMGLADDQVVEMSTDLSGLAGDIASFYNLDLDAAFEKIRSGISGETEPLKQLGINMSVVNLEAYAMSQGITKSYDAMTQAEQAMLRYNYLLSATSDAQGDFSRTSDGYANQLRLFEENLNSIKTEIGNSLIDAATAALTMMNDWMGSVIGETDTQGQIEQTKNDAVAEANQKKDQEYRTIDYMDDLLATYGEAATQTDEWAAATKALITVMPELAQYVDDVTGQITINTEQLRQNVDAIHNMAIYDAEKRALDAFAQDVDAANQAAADNLVQMILAQSGQATWEKRLQDAAKQAASSAANAARGTEALTWQEIFDGLAMNGSDANRMLDEFSQMGLITGDDYTYAQALIGSFQSAGKDVEDLNDKQKELNKTADDAQTNYENAAKAFEKNTGKTVEAMTVQDKYNNVLQDQADTLDQLQSAYDDLIVYQGTVRDEVRKTIDSIVGGFTDAPEAAEVSTTQIIDNLRKQQLYLDEYRQNLATARERGVSEDVLLALSDGSEDSAGVLRAIATMTDAEIESLNEQSASVQQAKDEAINAMSEVKLASDPVYQEMKDAVTDLVASFNQQDAARTNMLATGSGMISAMDETIAEMQTRVDTMQALFNKMLCMSIGMSFSGATGIVKPASGGGSGGITAATNAKGLDYVPYNDYLTYLHKGEAILSRAEAERYRAGSMQTQPTIDYDALGAVMAASMAGMSVQMDGRAVGVLIAPTVSQQIDQAARAGRFSG